MGQAKGGKKLRRSPKHASMYAAQFMRTSRIQFHKPDMGVEVVKITPDKEAA